MSLLRRLQPRAADEEEEAAVAELAGLQVLLSGSRQFGPASLRELTVRPAVRQCAPRSHPADKLAALCVLWLCHACRCQAGACMAPSWCTCSSV